METDISVIIPTYNSCSTLQRCIESVLRQSLPPKEIILVDDGSTDKTTEIVEKFPSIRYIYQENQGVSAARNRGVNVANGNFLLFLDSDDEVSDSWIVDFQSSSTNQPDLIFCNMKLISPKVPIVKKSDQRRVGAVIPGSWMICKQVFERVGGFDERLKFAENTELFFRLERLSLKKLFIQGENLIYHQSLDGGSKNLQNMRDSLNIILEKHASSLNSHVQHLYHQNLGVIEMRFKNFRIARNHIWKSWRFKPWKISTLIRLGITFFPLIASRVYPEEIKSA